jgi:hypothetical protein
MLLQLSAGYVCEAGCVAVTNVKTSKRTRLKMLRKEMSVSLSYVQRNIKEILNSHQAHPSH